jgi:cobalamin biosynthetic protein CobC
MSSQIDMAPTLSHPVHGGDLDIIRRRFPAAPEPWIDLSTGINPGPYPVPELAAEAWTRLPSRADELAACEVAAAHYGVEPDRLVAAPGSQAIIQGLPRLRARSRVAIAGPTYGEHAWSWAAAGHTVEFIDYGQPVPAGFDIVVVTRPNNPDGRIVPIDRLAEWAAALEHHGGWLVVDEAFADALPAVSVARDIANPALIALRSFGKFFGLAGCRLGFAIAGPELRDSLRGALGPWCASGPALAIARRAFADRAWIARTRSALAQDAALLDAAVAPAGLALVGGTPLFRLYACVDAEARFIALGAAGILVRHFPDFSGWLRLGLPATADDRSRLLAALAAGAPS